jgi:hypothetical protein
MQTNESKSWEELYMAAVLETDPTKAADRISTAQDALRERWHALRQVPLARVASRSRSSALVKQQAIDMSAEPCFMADSRAERRRSCANTRPFVRNDRKHARKTPLPMRGELPPRLSGARWTRG